jgi:hypothetical protein
MTPEDEDKLEKFISNLKVQSNDGTVSNFKLTAGQRYYLDHYVLPALRSSRRVRMRWFEKISPDDRQIRD